MDKSGIKWEELIKTIKKLKFTILFEPNKFTIQKIIHFQVEISFSYQGWHFWVCSDTIWCLLSITISSLSFLRHTVRGIPSQLEFISSVGSSFRFRYSRCWLWRFSSRSRSSSCSAWIVIVKLCRKQFPLWNGVQLASCFQASSM